jgi:hypothetical protein
VIKTLILHVICEKKETPFSLFVYFLRMHLAQYGTQNIMAIIFQYGHCLG